jgi:hypothetical protein
LLLIPFRLRRSRAGGVAGVRCRLGFVALPLEVAASLGSLAFALFDFVLLFVAAVVSPPGGVALADGSAAALSDFFLLAAAVLLFSAAGASPLGGVALAGSAAALFLVLLVAVGVPFVEFSPPAVVLASLFVFDLLLPEEVAAAPEALVELSVAAASPGSVFFLVFVFFEVVDVSPEAACGVAAVFVESAAGFFFFVVLVLGSLLV